MKSPLVSLVSRRTTVATLLLTSAFVGTISTARAQTYPFPNVSNLGYGQRVANFTIGGTQAPANNLLLGVQTGFTGGWTTYLPPSRNRDFNDPVAQGFIKKLKPTSLRFPPGEGANTYDIIADFNDTNPNRDESPYQGVRGIIDVANQISTGGGKNTDILWTFNVTGDDGTVAPGNIVQNAVNTFVRLKAESAKMDGIELGNELFWGQRETGQIKVNLKRIVSRLREKDSQVKFSIPLGWRITPGMSLNNSAYNRAMTYAGTARDTDYFDAVSIHRYVHTAGRSGNDALNPNDPNASAERDLITAGHLIIRDVKAARDTYAPGKEVWLSEWGVSGGGVGTDNGGYTAASFLGTIDSYIALFDNQNMITRANWFQTNNYDRFFTFTRAQVARDYTGERQLSGKTTGLYDAWQIAGSVFQNSVLLNGTMDSPELIPGSDAISAKAVNKGGETQILAVNKVDKPFRLYLKGNANSSTGAYQVETLAYNSLSDGGTERNFNVYDPAPLPLPLTSATQTNRDQFGPYIVLQPLSINVISFSAATAALKAPATVSGGAG